MSMINFGAKNLNPNTIGLGTASLIASIKFLVIVTPQLGNQFAHLVQVLLKVLKPRILAFLAVFSIVILSNLGLAKIASAQNQFIEGQFDGNRGVTKTRILKGFHDSYSSERIQIRFTHLTNDYRFKWYENDVLKGNIDGGRVDRTFKYGQLTWSRIPRPLSGYYTKDQHFHPNVNAFNNLPIGLTVKVEIQYRQNQSRQTGLTTLYIKRDNNEIEWNNSSTGSHNPLPTATTLDSQNGLITSHTRNVTRLSFKLELFENSATATETTLFREDVEPAWPGAEWTTLTPYGRWSVGNLTSCEAALCYNVKFDPDESTLLGLADRNLKMNLLINESIASSVKETDTLEYTFDSLPEFNLTNGLFPTNKIFVQSGTTNFADVAGSTNIFKAKSETISIEAFEIPNSKTNTTATKRNNSTTTNTDAGFSSKTYGTNATYGKWYFEETDQTASDDLVNTDYHNIVRRIKFIPDATALQNLSDNDEHISYLEIKIKRGNAVIATQQISIVIARPTTPILSISAVNSETNEGVASQFKVIASYNPGKTIRMYYTANDPSSYLGTTTQTSGNYRWEDLTFRETSPGSGVWEDTFSVSMRSVDGKDADHGIVSLTIAPDQSATKEYTVSGAPNNSAKVTVKDLDRPVISIANAPATKSTFRAMFKLTTTIEPWQPLAIRYIPTNSSGNFLDTTAGNSGATRIADPKIKFTRSTSGQTYEGILAIPTTDGGADTSGTISVQLLDDAKQTFKDYTITGTSIQNTKTAQIADTPIPELSIERSTLAIDEGGTATINITSDINPGNITFNYTPVDTRGNYLKETDGISGLSREAENLTFIEDQITNKWNASITISTKDNDMVDAAHGEITVILDTPSIDDEFTIGSDPDDRIVITVNDLERPVITIGNAPTVEGYDATTGNYEARFPLTASFQPYAPLTIKYLPTESGTGFLDPDGYSVNDIRSTLITFSGSNPTKTGTLIVPLRDNNLSRTHSGTLTVVLQADSANYTLPTQMTQKTGTTTIEDISYVTISFDKTGIVAVDTSDSEEKTATLFTDQSRTTYPHITAKTRHLVYDTVHFNYQAKWFVDGQMMGQSNKVTNYPGTLVTPYGNWVQTTSGFNWNHAGYEHTTRISRFEPNAEAINSISVGSNVRVEIHSEVPSKVISISTIHLVNNSSTLWDSNSSTTLSEVSNTSNATPREATIKTTQSGITGFSYKSKIIRHSIATVEQTLTSTEEVAEWAGLEYSIPTTYGKWIVGNQVTCDTTATCLDVRFEPDITAINGVTNEIIQVKLEVSSTALGKNEVDVLTYIIDGSSVAITLDENISATISASNTTAVINDITGSATIFGLSTDTLSIEATQTTTNQDTPTTSGTVSTTSNMDAGFASNQYITDLSLGSWYFAEANTGSSVADGLDSDYEKISRKILFRPKVSAITGLTPGSTRKSTLTIKTMRGTNIVTSLTFTITIIIDNLPTISIHAPENDVTEGGELKYIVTVSFDPGSAINTSYTVSEETEGTTVYLDTTQTTDSAIPVALNFTRQLFQGSMTWLDKIPVQLRTADGIDARHGKIKVTLSTPAANAGFLVNASRSFVTATVYDDTTPTISIKENAPATLSTLDAEFTLTARPKPWQPLAIRFIPTNSSGNYLDETDDNSGDTWVSDDPKVSFAPSEDGTEIVGTLSVPTTDDNANTSGTISVQLLDDAKTMHKDYTITGTPTENTKTVQISDIPIPMISIASSTISVTEGDTASIKIIASEDPVRHLKFHYTPTETGTSYLETTVGSNGESRMSGVSRTVTLEFTEDQTINKYTANLMIATNDIVGDSAHGSIAIVLDAPGTKDRYTVASDPNNKITITVNDDEKPKITIGDAPLAKDYESESDQRVLAKFPLTASFQPYAPLTLRYFLTETGSNFLKTAVSGPNDIRSKEITFTNGTGTLEIELVDDPNANAGTISIELKEDTINYTLSTQDAEKNATVSVVDPSYISMKFDNNSHLSRVTSSIDREHLETATLYIKDLTTTYSNFKTTTRLLGKDVDAARFQVKWFVDNVKIRETQKLSKGRTITTPYGGWYIHNYLGSKSAAYVRRHENEFRPNSMAINSIPVGSKVRIELHLEVPYNVTNTTILHFVHNTATTWTSNSKPTLFEIPNTSNVGDRKEATLTTFESDVTQFSYKSKLYDQSSSPNEQILTQTTDQVAAWAGIEHSVPTLYGRWIVGNQTTCETIATCFSIRFLPDANTINNISNRVVKVDLEITNARTGKVVTLSYLIDGSSVGLTLDQNNLATVRATATTTALHDVAGTTSLFYNSTDTLDIEATETTTNQATPTTGTVSTTTNMDAGFSSNLYITDLAYGSWYLAENDEPNAVTDTIDANYQLASRKFLFRPNPTAIAGLPEGATGVSTLTVKILRGSESIVSNSFTVTIRRVNLPIFSITAPPADVTEGGDLNFAISTNSFPGTGAINVSFSATQPKGDYLAQNIPTSANLTFRQDPGNATWTAELPISLRDANTTNTGTGTITITLTQPAANSTYLINAGNNASATILDSLLPVISIDDAPATFNGTDAQFTLRSQIAVNSPGISIKVKPTNSIGTFLEVTNAGASGAERTINNVTFTRSAADQPFTYTLAIPTRIDSNLTSGSFTVELIDNTSDPKIYTINQNDKSATVTIYRLTTLSIAPPNTQAEVNEGDSLNFIVTADFKPPNAQNSLNVKYSLTEPTSNFRHGTISTGSQPPVDLIFSKADDTSPWIANLSIRLRDSNQSIDAQGIISVTLDTPASGANYQVANAPDHSASVTVLDVSAPNISITNAPATFNGEVAQFTLTSHVGLVSPGITIKVKLTNNSGTFLDTTDGISGESREIENVTFARTDSEDTSLPFVYTLRIPTKIDTSEISGEIEVELIDESTTNSYNIINDKKTATVAVYRKSSLTIAPHINEVNEGEELKFVVTADYRPATADNSLDLNYNVTEANSNFRASTVSTGAHGPLKVIFEQAADSSVWTGEIPIALRDADQIDTVNGEISVSLVAPATDANFQVTTTPATATILDVDVPEFSIAKGVGTFHGEEAQFKITSDIQTTQSHTIMVTASNSSGTFLDESTYSSGTPRTNCKC